MEKGPGLSKEILNNQRIYSERSRRKQEDQQKATSNIKTREGGIIKANRVALFRGKN